MIDDPRFGIPERVKPLPFFAYYRTRRNLERILDGLETVRLRAILKKDFELDRGGAEEFITQLEVQIARYVDARANLDLYPRKRRRWWHILVIKMYEWSVRPTSS